MSHASEACTGRLSDDARNYLVSITTMFYKYSHKASKGKALIKKRKYATIILFNSSISIYAAGIKGMQRKENLI